MSLACDVELWGARRVAEALGGISLQRVYRYAREGVIPSTVPIEGSGWTAVWLADDIRRFVASGGRLP